MGNFSEPVSLFMSTPVHTVSQDAGLQVAAAHMAALDVTSLVVIDSSSDPVGVITSTDLLRNGLRNAGHGAVSPLLESSGKVSTAMTPKLISVDIGDSLTTAAKLMVSERVHRVFVMARGDVSGVVSTHDIMRAVEMARVTAPVSKYMSSPAYTIRASETVGEAAERLGKAKITGLIVVDDSQWPVGVFGQKEALEAGDVSRSTSIEKVMSPAVLTLPDQCATHNVVRQALAMKVRRVAVMNNHELIGVLTGADFAKAIA